MGIKSNLQNTAFQQALKSKLRKVRFDRIEMDFVRARKVGLLIDVTELDMTRIRKVREFGDQLRGLDKLVSLIGYSDTPAVPDQLGFDCFCKKDLNWALVPKGDLIDQFLGNEYDILINLDFQPSQTIDYLFQVAKAHIKVAYYYDDTIKEMAQLLLHNPKDNFTLYLKEILTHLKRINN